MTAPVDNVVFDTLMTLFFAAWAVLGVRAATRPRETQEALAALCPWREPPAVFAACGALTALAAAVGAAACGASLLHLLT